MNTPKPCPLCHGTKVVFVKDQGRDAYCPDCGCSFAWLAKDKDEAFLSFNRRPSCPSCEEMEPMRKYMGATRDFHKARNEECACIICGIVDTYRKALTAPQEPKAKEAK